MPKRVPIYLKQLPTKQDGKEVGGDPTEWGTNIDFLYWKYGNDSNSYTFSEEKRPVRLTNPESIYWGVYDWYHKAALIANKNFINEEKVKEMINKDSGLFSEERAKTGDLRYHLPVYRNMETGHPGNVRNIHGIAAWLWDEYRFTYDFLKDYNTKATKFNTTLMHFNKVKEEQKLKELKNKKEAAENKKYNDILLQLGDLRNKISKLNDNVKNLKVEKDKDFTLFKSELTSIIPNQSLNVTKIEHDEDIAQLNNTIREIRKKTTKATDSIFSLQEKVDVSNMKNSKSFEQLRREIDNSKKENSRLWHMSNENSDIFRARYDKSIKEQQENLAMAFRFIDRASKEQQVQVGKIAKTQDEQDKSISNLRNDQQEQSGSINNLRKELQALGGETRVFIDNAKRQEQAVKAKVAKKESVVTRIVKKAAFPDLTKRPWLKESVTGRFFQLANQW